MLTIPNELQTFYDTVSSGIGGMNSTLSTLTGKLTELSSSCSTASNDFGAHYNSENKDKILSKFSKISEILATVSSSVTGDLKDILSKCQELLDKITELIKLKEAVEAQEKIRDDEYRKEEKERNTLTISNANSIISKGTADFNRILDEANNMLRELKSMDESLDFVSQFSSNDYLAYLDSLQYGTFTLEKFTASNGTTIEYYIYVPDYGQEVEGLPVHMYLHGSGENYDRVLTCALPQLINNKQTTPSGIVICPQGHNNFGNKNYQNALIELLDETVKKYNADEDRVSLSGHSMGAITGYELIHDHPNYFSAFVPISGRTYLNYDGEDVVTKVWGFHGAKDSQVAYDGGVKSVEKLKNAGADVDFYTFESLGHVGIQTTTFEEKYEYKDGEEYYVLDWCFQQKREYS